MAEVENGTSKNDFYLRCDRPACNQEAEIWLRLSPAICSFPVSLYYLRNTKGFAGAENRVAGTDDNFAAS